MSVQICKSGIVKTDTLYDGNGGNILNGTRYTKENPYILSGKSSDIIAVTNNYAKVIPGTTYYLTAKTDTAWSSAHGYSTSTAGKATIWLYLRQTYNSSDTGYDSPILFTSSNWIKEGVWKYTIPSNMNMARIRFNTYSDGTNSVTVRFWDINLIPIEAYIGGENSSMRISKNSITMDDFIEN